MMNSFEEKANEIVKKNLPVNFRFVSREELSKNPNLIKLARGLPEHIKEVRIVDIEGFDQQACGGCHVKNTREVGNIKIVDTVNKGTNNRRVYFVLT
jgi:Ser-tRNA(Ala) deacylase AlaX